MTYVSGSHIVYDKLKHGMLIYPFFFSMVGWYTCWREAFQWREPIGSPPFRHILSPIQQHRGAVYAFWMSSDPVPCGAILPVKGVSYGAVRAHRTKAMAQPDVSRFPLRPPVKRLQRAKRKKKKKTEMTFATPDATWLSDETFGYCAFKLLVDN